MRREKGEEMGDKAQEITVQQRPPWIEDDTVKNCRSCNKEFGVFTRKVPISLTFLIDQTDIFYGIFSFSCIG